MIGSLAVKQARAEITNIGRLEDIEISSQHAMRYIRVRCEIELAKIRLRTEYPLRLIKRSMFANQPQPSLEHMLVSFFPLVVEVSPALFSFTLLVEATFGCYPRVPGNRVDDTRTSAWHLHAPRQTTCTCSFPHSKKYKLVPWVWSSVMLT